MQYIENKDYEFIPSDKDDWQIRFLSGDFIESVIKFGTIRMAHGDQMTFDFHVETSPDETLSAENEELQKHAGDILISIIEDAIENKATDLQIKEVK
jgi:hypothetical protein|tara:strand:- start:217 stop:507 length:291 start_codon:yes stop_codon:yes gene_type:complete